MLDHADAAILIGDPALLALEERSNRFERTGEELVYHDLAQEWRALTGLPFVSAVWGIASRRAFWMRVSLEDFIRSRDHGLGNIDALAAEWSAKLPSESTIRTYLSTTFTMFSTRSAWKACGAFSAWRPKPASCPRTPLPCQCMCFRNSLNPSPRQLHRT